MKISVPVFATIIATCLAVGSGGAWVAGKAAADPAAFTAPTYQEQKNAERIAAIEARQIERDKSLDQRLAAIETGIAAINVRLDQMSQKR